MQGSTHRAGLSFFQISRQKPCLLPEEAAVFLFIILRRHPARLHTAVHLFRAFFHLLFQPAHNSVTRQKLTKLYDLLLECRLFLCQFLLRFSHFVSQPFLICIVLLLPVQKLLCLPGGGFQFFLRTDRLDLQASGALRPLAFCRLRL